VDTAQYHSNAGNDYWATLDADVQQKALVRATSYIDKRFAFRFRGTRRRRTQALAWPRLGAYDNDGFYIDAIPVQVFRAACEYAMRAAYYNVLSPDVPFTVPRQDMTVSPAPASGDVVTGQIRSKVKKVGPIEVETSYITNAEMIQRWRSGESRSPQSSIVDDLFIPEYPEADLWIEALLRSPFGAAQLTRGD
jgi:hypothetical protein